MIINRDGPISNYPFIDVTDYAVKEEWVQKTPVKGDHIRVMRIGGLYAHHGIYVSDEEVIHFTGKDSDSVLDWSKCEVIKTDLSAFLKGGTLQVKEYSDEEFQDLYSPDQIVIYARSCIGDKEDFAVSRWKEFYWVKCQMRRIKEIWVFLEKQ